MRIYNTHIIFRISVVAIILILPFLFFPIILIHGKSPVKTNKFIEPDSVEKVTQLQEIIIKPKNKKYSKKNNPAVDLIRKVRNGYDQRNPERMNGYNYENYSKLTLGLADVYTYSDIKGVPITNRKKLENLIDTAIWTGKGILDLSVRETSSLRFNSNGNMKELVVGDQHDGLDKDFNDDYTGAFFSDATQEVDIYSNDIKLIRTSFVSPLSNIGPDFYKYHIEDTVYIGKDKCVELSFAPHNPETVGFNGKLFIPVDDSVKYVRRAMFRMPKAANVNFVKTLIISQNFVLDSLGKLHKELDDLVIDLQIAPYTPHLYMGRQTRRRNFSYQFPELVTPYIDKLGTKFNSEESNTQSPQFWETARQIPLSYAESNLLSKDSPFSNDKVYKWVNKAFFIVMNGYIPTAGGTKSKFDFGPINSILSHNSGTGWRIELNGMTTANLSKNIFGRGYVGYSFGNHRWNYGGEVEYSFNKKKYHTQEFPIHSIKAGYSDDVHRIDQPFGWNGSGTLTGSLSRASDKMNTYRKLAFLEYSKEWLNNLSIVVGINYNNEHDSPWVKFETSDGKSIKSFDQTIFKIRLRYAPNERIVTTHTTRQRVNHDTWTFVLDQSYGPKKFLGSRFNYVKTELGVERRFWFSSFGNLESMVRLGKVWTQVPFTELPWQPANTSYVRESGQFSLLNPMEFAMDQYALWDFTYHMNGLIFNRIPFIKKARLREMINFKGFVGHLSKRNNPEYNKNLFLFPNKNTIPMGKTPYMEISAGLENILTFLQIEYVWRLTYRDRPGIDRGGVRIGFHFDF